MGNKQFRPNNIYNKGEVVSINPCSFSMEQVPLEIKKLGNKCVVLQNTKLLQSRPDCQPIFVTRIKIGNHYETLLTKDLSR